MKDPTTTYLRNHGVYSAHTSFTTRGENGQKRDTRVDGIGLTELTIRGGGWETYTSTETDLVGMRVETDDLR